MKYTVLIFTVAFLLASIAGPATGPANGLAWGTPIMEDQETPPTPPQKVSPANPDTKQPEVGVWYCSQCGAANRYAKRRIDKPLHRPEPGFRVSEGAGCRAHRCAGMCECMGPPCGKKAKSGKRGKRFHARGHGRRGAERGRPGRRGPERHGPERMVAADRILGSSVELGLTDEQTKKLETLSFETKEKLIDLHASIEKERLKVRERMQSGTNDLTQIKRHLNAIAKAQVEVKEARIANLFDTRKVLTNEQKELLKEKHPRLGMTLD